MVMCNESNKAYFLMCITCAVSLFKILSSVF